jgi:hypothetical protein
MLINGTQNLLRYYSFYYFLLFCWFINFINCILFNYYRKIVNLNNQILKKSMKKIKKIKNNPKINFFLINQSIILDFYSRNYFIYFFSQYIN